MVVAVVERFGVDQKLEAVLNPILNTLRNLEMIIIWKKLNFSFI